MLLTFNFLQVPYNYTTWIALAIGIGLGLWKYLSLLRQHEKLLQEAAIAKARLDEKLNELRVTLEEMDRLRKLLDQIQKQLMNSEKMAKLGEFLAGIAHEINNPLYYVVGGLQAMEGLQLELFQKLSKVDDDDTTQKEIKELLVSISKGITRVTQIIRDLKNYSSADSNIDFSILFDVKECIDSARLFLSGKLKEKFIEVELDINHRSKLGGSQSQITQVLTNLLDNAIFAVNAGNRVHKIIRITTQDVAEGIEIRVIDNGIGIPEGIKGNIFNPFYTTKQKGEGTGLGLSISNTIITEHGGRLTFLSTQGVGTEFCITLKTGKN